jgi:cyclophilin family peptidyl-prolyl cis-trans isomerase
MRARLHSGIIALAWTVAFLSPSRVTAQAKRQAGASTAAPQTAAQRRSLLTDPSKPFWSAKAPASVFADIETSRGTITVELIRDWAPNGVDHFYNLARAGYYDDSRFFRVLSGFVAQFGIAGDPTVANLWGRRTIRADSVTQHNARGTISFAQNTPKDRTTNVFINLADNPSLDSLKFAPVGRIVSGMEVADSLYAGYGELPSADAPMGEPKRLYGEANKYLDVRFPKMDRIITITIRADSVPRQ